MIGAERVLAVIPARGGSKGVPRKNIREVRGKPLIAWTIAAARRSKYLDRIVVSTDSDEIAEAARVYGAEVPFMRPAHLAADDTPGIAPLLHALDQLPGYGWVVLLQPTSPLRRSGDIDACLDICKQRNAPACVTMTMASPPELMFRIDQAGTVSPVLGWGGVATRRQDLRNAYVLNGAVYAARSHWLRSTGGFLNEETVAYVMPQERSLDIDTEFDLNLFANMKASKDGYFDET